MKKIAVIGIGKMGLCFALQLEKAGCEVLGIDTNAAYVNAINNKTLRSAEPGVEEALLAATAFRASTRLHSLIAFLPELIFIAVPTPTEETGGYDHRLIDALLPELYALGLPPARHDVVIMCTTLPGYCDQKAAEALHHHCYLSYKPEFIAQGSIMHDLQYPDQVLIGEADTLAGDKLEKLYAAIHVSRPAICRISRLNAEIAKLATNCFLTMKIAFANAIGDLCKTTGADPGKVLDAIGKDSRIGGKFLQYGFGYGGPCFPRDNRALHHFAGRHGLSLLLSAATDQANQAHLQFQFEQYLHQYPDSLPIHFYSVTYKPGTLITEESQQLALAVKLARAGKKIIIHEREEVVQQLHAMMGDLFEYRIVGR